MGFDILPPVSGSSAAQGSAAWWEERYLNHNIPWDTGIIPPEVQALVSSGRVPRGWALDLGCGSGLSSCYLAEQGFRVVGVDLVQSALARGNTAARDRRLAAFFCRGDVLDLSFLRVQASLAIDVGCFHGVPPDRRSSYIASLARHLLPGAFYLLYAMDPVAEAAEDGPRGIGPNDLAALAPRLLLRWASHGEERTRPSSWYLFQRSAA